MTADFQTIPARSIVISIMDGPTAQPKQLLFEGIKPQDQIIAVNRRNILDLGIRHILLLEQHYAQEHPSELPCERNEDAFLFKHATIFIAIAKRKVCAFAAP